MATKKAAAHATDDTARADEQDDGLVAVEKHGEVIRVHPTCVKAHEAAGWKLVA